MRMFWRMFFLSRCTSISWATLRKQPEQQSGTNASRAKSFRIRRMTGMRFFAARPVIDGTRVRENWVLHLLIASHNMKNGHGLSIGTFLQYPFRLDGQVVKELA